jgi:hypothetical protein
MQHALYAQLEDIAKAADCRALLAHVSLAITAPRVANHLEQKYVQLVPIVLNNQETSCPA